MNSRELRLLVALVLIVGGGGGAVLAYQWFYKPLGEYNLALKKLNRDIDLKSGQLAATLEARKLLERARLMSLSPNPDAAIAEYGKYLEPLLRGADLEIDSFKPAGVIEVKASGPAGAGGQGAAAVKPGHQIVAFQVRARGTLDALVKALETLQKTPLVHRVRHLTIERVDRSKNTSDTLAFVLTVESLMVNRAEMRVDGPLAPDQRLIVLEALLTLRHGPTGLAMMPWVVGPTGPLAKQRLALESGYRRYRDVPLRNIFIGRGSPKLEEEPDDDPVPEFEVTEYVRLDTTDPVGKEAFFRYLVYKTAPIRVRAVPRSGYDTFRIQSELKTRILLKGKVLLVEQRDVYFQVKEDVYAVHLGQTLADAMRRPLSDEEIEVYGLSKLYDAAWGAREVQESLAAIAKKKKKR